jgi:hypothetical protein
MANILTWAIAGLAIGALMAPLFPRENFGLNLIGGAIICTLTGLLLPLLHLSPLPYAVALLSLIIGGLARQLLGNPTSHKAG